MALGQSGQAEPLENRSDRFRLLVEAVVDAGIALIDPEGRIVSWNKGAEQISGWTEAEALGRHFGSFHTPDELKAGLPHAALEAARTTGHFVEEGYRVRKDGSLVRVLTSIVPLFDADQRLLGFAGTSHDVTARAAAENAYKVGEQRLRSILETVLDGIVVIDATGIIQTFSPAAVRIFEYQPDEVIGRNVSMLMPSPYREQHDGYLARYLNTGERRIIGIGRVVVGLRKNGDTFPMELGISEFSVGEERLFTGMVRDLTEREETEKRVQTLQAELLHVSRLSVMGRMASTLAHELNQPLTAIANYLQATHHLLKAGQLDVGRLDDFVTKAAAQSQRAGEVIRRLRAFVAKGETERSREDLNAIVEEATAFALVGARLQGVRMSLSLAEDLPSVSIDKTQIQQVIVNLVRNAVEAMEGMPERLLNVSTRAIPPERRMEVAVADTGPGLAPEIAANLFQPFFTSKPGGMGLGLSICREIVEAQGGQIVAESNPGKGTTFRFTLPQAEDKRDDE